MEPVSVIGIRIVGQGGVEALALDVKVRVVNVDDVGAGVEGLVGGLIKLGDVLDLQGGPVAGVDRGRAVRDGDTGVAKIEVTEREDIDERLKVIVGLRVCDSQWLAWLCHSDAKLVY